MLGRYGFASKRWCERNLAEGPTRHLLLVCANTNKAIKYYQDATFGNAAQKRILQSVLTLKLAMTTTQDRNHKHCDPI